jgi:serine/threonine-protein kinase
VLHRGDEIGPMPIDLACFVVQEVAAALAYAHSLSDENGRPLEIVHRDVSPANILLSHLGDVKLSDFGIARAADDLRDELTRTGVIKGKVSYMSPEQAAGKPLDARSDVFSLGIVLHEALTQSRLFAGKDLYDTLARVRTLGVPPPSRLRAGVPPALDALVATMLERDAARRPTCAQVASALAPLVHSAQASHERLADFLALRSSYAAPRTAVSAAPATVTSATRPGVAPRPRHHVRLALAAGGCALVVAALALRPSPPAEPPTPPLDAPEAARATVAVPPPLARESTESPAPSEPPRAQHHKRAARKPEPAPGDGANRLEQALPP